MRWFACLLIVLVSVGAAPCQGGELVGSEAARERLYPNIVEPDLVFGGHGSGDSQFLQIRKVSFTDDTHVVIADCAANRIQEFDIAGHLKRTLATKCPTDLAVMDDYIAIFSEHTGEIALYDRSFGHIRSWYVDNVGDHRVVAIAANSENLYAISRQSGQIIVFDLYGRPSRHIAFPRDARVVSAATMGSILYLSDKLGAQILAIRTDTGQVHRFGEYGTFAGEMANPDGIAVTTDGVWVVDTVNHRVQRFAHDGTFSLQFGRHPISPLQTSQGRMHYPHNIAINETGDTVIVCEPFESRCNIFSVSKIIKNYKVTTDSAWWNKFFYFHYRGPSRVAKISFMKPGHEISEPYLFMGEEDIHRIVVSKMVNGLPETFTAFGEFGTGPGQFKGPEGVFPGPQGNLYVVDTGNNRVQVFDFEGNFKFEFGRSGSGPGEFNEPGQGSADATGNLYISDSGNARVQVFTESGQYLREFGTSGSGNGQLLRPIDAYVDEARSRILVSDIFNRKIEIFDLSGNPVQTIGSEGLGLGQFMAPHSVVVDDATGNIFISDMVNNSIQKFSPDGQFLSRIGGYGLALGEFKTPAGLAVDDGKLIVMDHTNHRGQVLDAGTGVALFAFGEGVIGVPGESVIMRDSLRQLNDILKVDPQDGAAALESIRSLKREIQNLDRQLNRPLDPK